MATLTTVVKLVSVQRTGSAALDMTANMTANMTADMTVNMTVNMSEAHAAEELATIEAASSSLRQAYHEVIGENSGQHHVIELDVLEQLKNNLTQLEDLHGRLKFMMGEVSYLIVR